MQVIKNGRYSEPRKCECPDCGCEFVFTCDDLEWHKTGVVATVECPQCHEVITVIVEDDYCNSKPFTEEMRVL